MSNGDKGNPHLVQGEVVIDDEQANQKQSGMNFQKIIQEMLNTRQFVFLINGMNLSMTIIVCVTYLYRTYDMCLFDKEPIW
jgi:hypothetical protein